MKFVSYFYAYFTYYFTKNKVIAICAARKILEGFPHHAARDRTGRRYFLSIFGRWRK